MFQCYGLSLATIQSSNIINVFIYRNLFYMIRNGMQPMPCCSIAKGELNDISRMCTSKRSLEVTKSAVKEARYVYLYFNQSRKLFIENKSLAYGTLEKNGLSVGYVNSKFELGCSNLVRYNEFYLTAVPDLLHTIYLGVWVHIFEFFIEILSPSDKREVERR